MRPVSVGPPSRKLPAWLNLEIVHVNVVPLAVGGVPAFPMNWNWLEFSTKPNIPNPEVAPLHTTSADTVETEGIKLMWSSSAVGPEHVQKNVPPGETWSPFATPKIPTVT